jgi:hypothetical protein
VTARVALFAAALMLVPILAGAEMPATIEERCPCPGPQPGKSWPHHGAYVMCVYAATADLYKQGALERNDATGLMQRAVDSQCGARKVAGPCGGPGGASCEQGFACNVVDRTCRGTDVPGRCVPVPAQCPPAKEPVCGCDGVTYASDCERLHAGAILARSGACVEPCGGTQTKSCPDGKLCAFPTGSCGEDERTGECVPPPPKPCTCTQRNDPVCGCDGENYPNPCSARCAGVSIRKRGKCQAG